MFSGTICVQRAAYKIVSNDTTSKRARFVLNVIKRLGSPRGAYRAASMRTSENAVNAKFVKIFYALGADPANPLNRTWG
jgi:hypothetical protein